ncbi:DUF4192 domain-containing protein [Actinoplanes sp. NPDC049316]|uniref:DUF4192 domain-containing protein n=1 Tax=Actinoplanes sp. NPDC049316 TaxID=3154727 RepID=UPI003440D022
MTNPVPPGASGSDPAGSAVKARTPADLVASIALGMGYHPHDQVVLAGVRDGKLAFLAADTLALPGTDGGEPPRVREMVQHAVRNAASAVFIVGYGTPAAVDPVLRHAEVLCRQYDMAVADLLRVTSGRVFSLLCTDPRCCPPEGTTLDLAASPVTATAVTEGVVIRSSRAALLDTIAPAGGAQEEAMSAATRRAAHRALLLTDVGGLEGMLRATREAITAAVARYRDGGRLDDDELAWLTVHLLTDPAREMVLRGINPREPWHVELWSDVVRRTTSELVAAPAALLAFAAWRTGNGPLAYEAVRRALSSDPNFPLAVVLEHLLACGASPDEFTRRL